MHTTDGLLTYPHAWPIWFHAKTRLLRRHHTWISKCRHTRGAHGVFDVSFACVFSSLSDGISQEIGVSANRIKQVGRQIWNTKPQSSQSLVSRPLKSDSCVVRISDVPRIDRFGNKLLLSNRQEYEDTHCQSQKIRACGESVKALDSKRRFVSPNVPLRYAVNPESITLNG